MDKYDDEAYRKIVDTFKYLNWTCVHGHVNGDAIPGPDEGITHFTKMCAVCGAPRRKRKLYKTRDSNSVVRIRCDVGFDSDIQVLKDGRDRGFWVKTRSVSWGGESAREDEAAVLLEWSKLRKFLAAITKALEKKRSDT